MPKPIAPPSVALVPTNGKTATKTARPSPRSGVSLPLGDHPGNTGGKPGRSGRKPNAWKQAMTNVLKKSKAEAVLTKIISGDIQEQLGTDKEGNPIVGETKNADRLGAIKFAAAYAEGQPTERHEITGADGGPIRQVWKIGDQVIEF